MKISPLDVEEGLRGLTFIRFASPQEVRWVLRSILAKSYNEQQLFDLHYDEYWKQLDRAVDSKIKEDESVTTQHGTKDTPPSLQSLKSWLYGNNEVQEEEIASYSATTVVTQKDFSAFTEDEREEVMRWIEIMAQKLAHQKQRRYKKSTQGKFDMRHTVRANLRRGGEWIHLLYKQRKQRRLKLVLICDVSKSMDIYSRFFVQFLYGFQQISHQIETFVFSTHLHRITEQLHINNFQEAWAKVSERVPDWSGGTRIGASLQTFTQEYRGLLNRRSVVLIMSDGWDTGDMDVLEESMEEIQRHVLKVIWLNPLAGNPNFQPSVLGMQTAMPYIDIFTSAHNLESLQKVVEMID